MGRKPGADGSNFAPARPNPSVSRRHLLCLEIFAAGWLFLPAHVQARNGNSCDLNGDGKVDAADVQAAINMTLGLAPCTANIAGKNVCNIVVVQRVIAASLGRSCLTSSGMHVVSLSWRASTSRDVTGYVVYRGAASGGPYEFLASAGNVTTYTDTTVISGQTYYYVITSLSRSGGESEYSAPVQAVIPTP